jgi:hypothetical protein
MTHTCHIPGWTKEFLAMKRKGFNDVECCQRAGISLEKLKTHKSNDVAFAMDYEEAKTVGTTRKALLW